MKILVVDDEWAICELLSTRLRRSGFEVSVAYNEREFREKVFFEKPQLIIPDIILGEQNGVELYGQLLREGLDSAVPVIFLSVLARGYRDDPIVPGRRYALYGKPFDATKLVTEINELARV